jgi:hypothetical protein
MSQHRVTGSSGWVPGCILTIVTVLVLCWVISAAIWAPFGMFYELLHEDRFLADRAAQLVANNVWGLVGPLIVLNLCWMVYAFYRRWSESRSFHSPLPDHAADITSAPSVPEQKTAATHIQPDASRFKTP